MQLKTSYLFSMKSRKALDYGQNVCIEIKMVEIPDIWPWTFRIERQIKEKKFSESTCNDGKHMRRNCQVHVKNITHEKWAKDLLSCQSSAHCKEMQTIDEFLQKTSRFHLLLKTTHNLIELHQVTTCTEINRNTFFTNEATKNCFWLTIKYFLFGWH